MTPLLNRLRYFLTDAWDEWRHSPSVNLLAVATLSAALFVAGLILLVVFNIGGQVERLLEDIRVEIYLQDEIEPAMLEAIGQRLSATEGVARVEFIDKDEALRRFREWSGDDAELLIELDANPLPASFDVYLRPRPDAREIARLVVASNTGKPGVEEARFDEDWLENLEAMVGLAQWGGALLALLVFSAVVFVMASVLRLAVYARRDEIDIMLLVGATPGFVRGPFLAGGVAQGFLASVLALALVETARRLFVGQAETGGGGFAEMVGQPLPVHLSLLLVLVGLTVAVAGAFFAVRRWGRV